MQAIKYRTRVTTKGKIALPRLRLTKSTPVEVIILVGDVTEDESELTAASSTSLDFWHNPTDDRIWNDA